MSMVIDRPVYLVLATLDTKARISGTLESLHILSHSQKEKQEEKLCFRHLGTYNVVARVGSTRSPGS